LIPIAASLKSRVATGKLLKCRGALWSVAVERRMFRWDARTVDGDGDIGREKARAWWLA
jgi:hypothetical protein